MHALSPTDVTPENAPLVVLSLAGIVAVMVAVWGAIWLVRYLRADSMLRTSMRQEIRVRRRWQRVARMAGLSVTDRTSTLLSAFSTQEKKPEPRVLVPRIITKADRYGVHVRAKCLPKVGLEEYQRAARYLADDWGCRRLSVRQDGPGHVILRGVREDPLLAPTSHTPSGLPPENLAVWNVGVDEYADTVRVSLSNVPGVAVAGLPGFGKTSLINRLLCDLAPSNAVQFAVADGKVTSADEGDYADLTGRLFDFVGDDLAEANALFQRMKQLRRDRSAAIRSVLGVKNFWHRGPSSAWPLVVLIIDEAHTYMREHKGNDPGSRKLAALAAENARLVEDLVKKGRSVGMVVIIATQKATGDAIPTFIRDVCPVGLSFAQKTADASVAALGEDIRNWPDANPVSLQDPRYVGVAVQATQGQEGFTRIRTPYVDEADAARVAAASAHLTRDPVALLASRSRLGLTKGPGFGPSTRPF